LEYRTIGVIWIGNVALSAILKPGVTGVTMTAQVGQIVAPPPDGASYLGFIFGRAFDPAQAEMALRIAHRNLNFDIRPEYPVVLAHEATGP
jgi:L-amino acid ligase C-terminal domain 2